MGKNKNLHAAKKAKNDEFCLRDAIQNGNIIFLRADGTPTENLVVWNCNSEGYYNFFEILGASGVDGPKKLTIGGGGGKIQKTAGPEGLPIRARR